MMIHNVSESINRSTSWHNLTAAFTAFHLGKRGEVCTEPRISSRNSSSLDVNVSSLTWHFAAELSPQLSKKSLECAAVLFSCYSCFSTISTHFRQRRWPTEIAGFLALQLASSWQGAGDPKTSRTTRIKFIRALDEHWTSIGRASEDLWGYLGYVDIWHRKMANWQDSLTLPAWRSSLTFR